MRRVWSGARLTDSVLPVGPAPFQTGGPELHVGTTGPKTIRHAAAWASGVAGVTLDQVTTYEVTALSDTGVTYATTTEQVATEGDLDPATLPDGSTARLLSSDVRGTGTGTMDLAALVATASSQLTGTQVVEVAVDGGDPVELTQQLDVGLTVNPAG